MSYSKRDAAWIEICGQRFTFPIVADMASSTDSRTVRVGGGGGGGGGRGGGVGVSLACAELDSKILIINYYASKYVQHLAKYTDSASKIKYITSPYHIRYFIQ